MGWREVSFMRYKGILRNIESRTDEELRWPEWCNGRPGEGAVFSFLSERICGLCQKSALLSYALLSRCPDILQSFMYPLIQCLSTKLSWGQCCAS